MTHIVWDWNGTLFNDIDAVVEATNEVFASYELPPVSLEAFQLAYPRPVGVSYERMLGRALVDGEWERLALAFHDAYRRLMEHCALAADATPTMEALAGAGHTQSLLSMWRHDRLNIAVRR